MKKFEQLKTREVLFYVNEDTSTLGNPYDTQRIKGHKVEDDSLHISTKGREITIPYPFYKNGTYYDRNSKTWYFASDTALAIHLMGTKVFNM